MNNKLPAEVMNHQPFVIDMARIRATLPSHGTAVLHKKIAGGKTILYIECWISQPSLSEMNPCTFEQDFDMIKQWQREILSEALSEFYTEQTGHEWKIYLNRIPIQFINASDDDVKAFSGYSVEQLKENKNV